MLAIVIPYYKKKFFRETMESIAAQTCKDFVLYIGDDASPENPQDIIEEYKDKIQIVYHRFDENLGGKDLVAQWERCIDLTKGEDWLWLFSDDDTMENTCVMEFYSAIKEGLCGTLLRLKKEIVYNNQKSYITTYKSGISSFEDFLLDCLFLTKNNPTIPEFIFARTIYNKIGFIKFPLAWGTDRISFLRFVMETGFLYNLSSVVHFKMSGYNISSNFDNTILEIKNKARIMSIAAIREIIDLIPKKYPNINMSTLSNMIIDRFSFMCKSFPIKDRIIVFKYLWPIGMSFKSKKTLLKFILGQ